MTSLREEPPYAEASTLLCVALVRSWWFFSASCSVVANFSSCPTAGRIKKGVGYKTLTGCLGKHTTHPIHHICGMSCILVYKSHLCFLSLTSHGFLGVRLHSFVTMGSRQQSNQGCPQIYLWYLSWPQTTRVRAVGVGYVHVQGKSQC